MMIGLPEAGKTTFLAAFWNVVESSDCKLSLYKLPAQSEYISAISKKWVNCEPLERTVTGTEKTVELTLTGLDTNELFNLVLPDLSGERFEAHFTERQWDSDYEDLIADSHGILLFVNPNKVEDPILISQAAAAGGKDMLMGGKESEAIDWDSSLAPTQVKLVDILQFHANNCIKPIHKIAVIISAWDSIVTNEKTPREWMQERLPLLHQFLKANNNISYKVFGVSAQGGDIEKNKKALLKITNPIERIIVKDENIVGSDLSSPLTWVFGD